MEDGGRIIKGGEPPIKKKGKKKAAAKKAAPKKAATKKKAPAFARTTRADDDRVIYCLSTAIRAGSEVV